MTLRAKHGIPSFRAQRVQALFAGVIRDQRRRYYEAHFRVIHWSIQSNHLHLVIEADTEHADGYLPLRSGVSGLAIAFARRLNLMLGRKGPVWADRYHRHDLKSPTEARSAFGYVFRNHRKHGACPRPGTLDRFSSACVFHGWDGPHFVPPDDERSLWPACAPQTWLARHGVILHGPLSLAADG